MSEPRGGGLEPRGASEALRVESARAERARAQRYVQYALAVPAPDRLVDAMGREAPGRVTDILGALRSAESVVVPSGWPREPVERLASLAPRVTFFATFENPPNPARPFPSNVRARLQYRPVVEPPPREPGRGVQDGPVRARDPIFPAVVGEGVVAIDVEASCLFREPVTVRLPSTLRDVELRLNAGAGCAGFARSFFEALARAPLERLILEGNFYLPDLMAFRPPATLRRFGLVSSEICHAFPGQPGVLLQSLAGASLIELETNLPQLVPYATTLERLTLRGPSFVTHHLGTLSSKWSVLSKLRSLTIDRLAVFANRSTRVNFPASLESFTLNADALDEDTRHALRGPITRAPWRSLRLDVPGSELRSWAARSRSIESLGLALSSSAWIIPTPIGSSRLALDLASVPRVMYPALDYIVRSAPRLVELDLSAPSPPQGAFELDCDRLTLDPGDQAARLEALDLSRRGVTTEALEKSLPKLSGLRRLSLQGTALEGDVSRLPWHALPRLEVLDLSKTRAAGTLTALISALPTTLTHLDVRETCLWIGGAFAQTSGLVVEAGGAPPPPNPPQAIPLRSGA